MHDAEDPNLNSYALNQLKRYADAGVKNYYCDLDAFLEFPHDVCEFMIEDSIKRKNKRETSASKTLDELNESMTKK